MMRKQLFFYGNIDSVENLLTCELLPSVIIKTDGLKANRRNHSTVYMHCMQNKNEGFVGLNKQDFVSLISGRLV